MTYHQAQRAFFLLGSIAARHPNSQWLVLYSIWIDKVAVEQEILACLQIYNIPAQ
jgi:hypothetical protein